MIYPVPVTLQLYKKALIFTIKFTLNFFLPPFRFVLLAIMLSTLVLKVYLPCLDEFLRIVG